MQRGTTLHDGGRGAAAGREKLTLSSLSEKSEN